MAVCQKISTQLRESVSEILFPLCSSVFLCVLCVEVFLKRYKHCFEIIFLNIYTVIEANTMLVGF